MRIDRCIDKEEAIEVFGNDVGMFYMMLGNLEKMTLNKTMKLMVIAYNDRDYQKMKNLAHNLKGVCSYVGAGRMHYVTYYIQKNFVMKNYDKMLEFYPSLVEAVIEFNIESRKLLAAHNSLAFVLTPEMESCDHSNEFKLIKDHTGYIFCVKTG